MSLYDIHNPTQTMRIIHDGILNSNKMIRVAPGETKRGVRLGEPTIKLIQGRQNNLLLMPAGEPELPREVMRSARSRADRPHVRPAQPTGPIPPVAPHKIAVVVGSAEGVFDEWDKTKALCGAADCEPVSFVINDTIPLFPDHIDHAVTLHPDKYEREWGPNRLANKLPAANFVWSHRKHRVVNRDTPDWGGSSGLFAIKIALELGYQKILLCGVPMTVEGNHVTRHVAWRACDQFRKAWERHRRELAPHVRSFSGWTQTTFGPATAGYIANGLPPRVGPELQAGRVAEPVD